MPWDDCTMDWKEFLGFVSVPGPPLGALSTDGGFFRGQANVTWPLRPSIARSLGHTPSGQAANIERMAVDEFKMHAHLHIPHHFIPSKTQGCVSVDNGDREFFEWLALMQHYRAPTRLLDWTTSVYVAAYFAVADEWDEPGAIWFFFDKFQKDGMANDATEDNSPHAPFIRVFEDRNSAKVRILRSTVNTERMIAQQGWFTACEHPQMDHGDVIDGCSQLMTYRIIIEADSKPEFLRHLRGMNITANTLFPGIDGLGRSVSELVRIKAGGRRVGGG